MMRRSLSLWFLAASFASLTGLASNDALAQKSGDKAKAQPKAGAQPKSGQPAEGEDPAPEKQPEAEPSGEPEPEPTGDAGGEIDLGADPTAAPESKLSQGERVSWQDIVVVVRKPFLKQRRLE